MKKVFALLLALILALSLAACGEDESTPGGDNTSGGGSSTTQQGGNKTNNSGAWSDADKQTVSEDKKLGHYEFTVWDAKEMDSDTAQHPGASNHLVNYTDGQAAVLYAPFKIIYTNTTKSVLDGVCGIYVLEGGDSAKIYIALESDSAYKSSTDAVGTDGTVAPGETITAIGYFEIDPYAGGANFSFTGASLGVEFPANSRPIIKKK